MLKTTFKIATKFQRFNRNEPLKPIEYQEVEGLTIGNWGLVKYCEHYRVYHTKKGLPLSFYYFELDNALIALQKAVEMFGENHDGEPKQEDSKLLKKWEWECFNFLPDDDDDDDEL
ncbi:MAG: hypothetical protein ACKPEN_16555 [Planktothrix sp.]|uniref:hypothetical protein n=1 Tax=Planktothrix sp. TaxID=3088171 RepID=UPI0038D4F4E1